MKEKLPTKTFDELVSLVVKDAAQDAANLITKNGISLFGSFNGTTTDLS